MARSTIEVRYALSTRVRLIKLQVCRDWYEFADWLKNMNEQGHIVCIHAWTYTRRSEDQIHGER